MGVATLHEGLGRYVSILFHRIGIGFTLAEGKIVWRNMTARPRYNRLNRAWLL